MANTPPGYLPVISDGTTVRFKLGALSAVATALIGGSIYCTVFYLKVDALDRRLARIEKALGIGDADLSKIGTIHGGNP